VARVRPAAQDDLPALTAIEASNATGAHWDATQLAEELDRSMSRVTVVEDAGQVLGYMVHHEIVDRLELVNICIAESVRRRGFGRLLCESLLEGARRAGATAVDLEVRAGNGAAIGLYYGLGFEAVGRRKAYYRDGEDAVLMTLNFSAACAVQP
jgi:[ribosomal protein S18]-alanine N-acetyltransferase